MLYHQPQSVDTDTVGQIRQVGWVELEAVWAAGDAKTVIVPVAFITY
jgi:hypothetical protein